MIEVGRVCLGGGTEMNKLWQEGFGLMVMAHNQRMYRLFRVKSTLQIPIAGCDM